MVSDLCSPEDLTVTPEYSGSSQATITWSFDEPVKALTHFRITVETEDGGTVFDDCVVKDRRKHLLENLRPMKKHKISVVAVYSDGNQKPSSLDFYHAGMSLCYDILADIILF